MCEYPRLRFVKRQWRCGFLLGGMDLKDNSRRFGAGSLHDLIGKSTRTPTVNLNKLIKNFPKIKIMSDSRGAVASPRLFDEPPFLFLQDFLKNLIIKNNAFKFKAEFQNYFGTQIDSPDR